MYEKKARQFLTILCSKKQVTQYTPKQDKKKLKGIMDKTFI